MVEYTSHTVTIDDLKFFAQDPKSEQPVQRRRKVEIKIEEGPSKWLFKGSDLRTFSFTTFMAGDVDVTRERLNKLANKICEFSSPYIGTFKCIVEWKPNWQNGTPNMTYIDFEIQEVV